MIWLRRWFENMMIAHGLKTLFNGEPARRTYRPVRNRAVRRAEKARARK